MSHVTKAEPGSISTIGKDWYYEKIRETEAQVFDLMARAEMHADAGQVEAAVDLLGQAIRKLIAAQRRLAHEVFGA